MRLVLPIVLVFATAAFLVLGFLAPGGYSPLELSSNSRLPGLTPVAHTPEQAVADFLQIVQRKKLTEAFASLANHDKLDESHFIRDISGTGGSLRTLSSLAGWDLHPLRATERDANIRVTLHWATPVGTVSDVQDLAIVRQDDTWRVVWPSPRLPDVAAQIIPVNYLRWDLVSSSGDKEWGEGSIDAPNVRIVSMNAVEHDDATVVMGEVLNEDTVPAFVNVNATLLDDAGKVMAQETSFDKILHVLLPKQATPYRIDFPGMPLQRVKNVRMDIKATLVPASADPVIGVMEQRLADDSGGKKLLQGQLLNQSGQVVNIPHVIATFYDGSGKVIWVSDGYVERALFPQIPESFAVEVPASVASKVQNFHVVVNQYSLNRS